MARRITVDMLKEHIEKQIPLYESGDIVGSDILLYCGKNSINNKIKKVLNNKLVSKTDYLVYEFQCPNCHQTHSYNISVSNLHREPLSFGYKHGYCIEYSVGDSVKPSHVLLLLCLAQDYSRNVTLCSSCVKDKIKEWSKKMSEFYNTDKRAYWLELLKGKTEKELRWFIQHHPFGWYYCNDTLNFSPDGKLTDIIEIKDILLNNKSWKNPAVMAEEARKREIYQKAYQEEKTKEEDRRLAEAGRKDARRDVYNTFMCETDRFVLKYCKPSVNDASLDDLREILNTEGLNEPQLQTSLRAMLYDDFLKTIYWKAICSRRKYLDGCKCSVCGKDKQLHVHHVSYDHHGDERHHLEDLVTLCKKCHNEEHRKNQIERPV